MNICLTKINKEMENEVAVTVFSVVITLFMGAWIVFGIRWIRKTAKSFSGTPVSVDSIDTLD